MEKKEKIFLDDLGVKTVRDRDLSRLFIIKSLQMNTTIVLPDMKGQKITILKENGGGFYFTMDVVVKDQGTGNYHPFGEKPFFTYTIGKKKGVQTLYVTPDDNIAIFTGHIVIDTEHQYIDDVNENVGCFNPINFDRSLSSTDQQPIFINRKRLII